MIKIMKKNYQLLKLTNSRTDLSITVNGSMAKDKDVGHKYGRMAHTMKGIGQIIKQMEEAV